MDTVINYLSSVREEFRHVTWPTRKEAFRLTLFVVGGSLLVGLFVGGTDAVLIKVLGLLLNK